jgi:hypothetical protein
LLGSKREKHAIIARRNLNPLDVVGFGGFDLEGIVKLRAFPEVEHGLRILSRNIAVLAELHSSIRIFL